MKKTKLPFVVIKCNSSALTRIVLVLLKDFGANLEWLDRLVETKANLGTIGNFSTQGNNQISQYSQGDGWFYGYGERAYNGAVNFNAATQMGELIEWLTKVTTTPKLAVLLKEGCTATVEGDGTKVKVGCQEFSTACLNELMDEINETFPNWNK